MIFPITYILFKLGYSPVVLSWTSLVVYAILGIIVKPWLIIKIVDYKCSEIWSVYRSCLIVTVASLPIPIIIYKLVDTNQIVYFILLGLVCLISVALSAFFLGIDKAMRKKVQKMIFV